MRSQEITKRNRKLQYTKNLFEGGLEKILEEVDKKWKLTLASEFYQLYYHFGLTFLKEQVKCYSDERICPNEILTLIDMCNNFYEAEIETYQEQYWNLIKETHSRECIIAYTPLSRDSIIDYIQTRHNNISQFTNTISAMLFIYATKIGNSISYVHIRDVFSMTTGAWFEDIFSYIQTHPNIAIRNVIPRIRKLLKYYLKNADDDYCEFVLELFDKAMKQNDKDLISWKQVFFMNGYLLIFHPEHPDGQGKYKPFRYSCSESIKAFNHVSEYILKKLPPIQVKYKDDVIIGINPDSVLAIQEAIGILDSYSKTPNTKVVGLKQGKFHALKQDGYTNEQVKKALKALKSDYLDYLSDRQLNTEKLYYCLERRINTNLISVDEDAFLFSLKQNPIFTLLAFENTLPSRATILFVCANEKINETINFIHEYFSSPKMNKRERLIFEQLDLSEYGIINYTRVMHDSYSQWVKAIMKVTKEISC